MANSSLESELGDVNADIGGRDVQVFDLGHEVRRRSYRRPAGANARTLGIERGIGMRRRLGEGFS